MTLNENLLSIKAVAFCKKYGITNSVCRATVYNNLRNLLNYLHRKHNLKIETGLLDKTNRYRNLVHSLVPNPHLARNSIALASEEENLRCRINDRRIQDILQRENLVERWFANWIQQRIVIPSSVSKPVISSQKLNKRIKHNDLTLPNSRFVVIHSCLLPSTRTVEETHSQSVDDKEIYQLYNVTENYFSLVSMNESNKNQQESTYLSAFQKRRTRVLRYLLDEVHEFLSQNSNNTLSPSPSVSVFVLHFGEPLPLAIVKSYPLVQFLYISNDISFFEIPTIRLIQNISKMLISHYDQIGLSDYLRKYRYPHNSSKLAKSRLPNVYPQLLYLHTKGVSYAQVYPQIEEWRNYMLYFLLERQIVARQLLASGRYDVYGSNYETNSRLISGNFWWATCTYLASTQLPRIDYWDTKTDKYSAEKWLLRSNRVRIYMAFASGQNHVYRRYPRYCYARIDEYFKKNHQRFADQEIYYIKVDSEGNEIEGSESDYSDIFNECHQNEANCEYVNPFSYMFDADIMPNQTVWSINCDDRSVIHFRKIHAIFPLLHPIEYRNSSLDLIDRTGCYGFEVSNRNKNFH